MFDLYICLGAHGSGAGSEKDPSAAERGQVGLGSLCGKEDYAGQEINEFLVYNPAAGHYTVFAPNTDEINT